MTTITVTSTQPLQAKVLAFVARLLRAHVRMRKESPTPDDPAATRAQVQLAIDTYFPDHNDDDDDTWQPAS